MIVFGAAAGVALLIENGFHTWSAEHLKQTLGASATVGGAAAALFAAGAAAGRFWAYRFGSALADARLLASAAAAGALGAALAASAPHRTVALVGITLSGAGISIIFPLLISQTGRRAAPATGPTRCAVTPHLHVGRLACSWRIPPWTGRGGWWDAARSAA